MRISTQIGFMAGREAADRVRELEGAGLDVVWIAEAYGFDAPTLAGYVAAQTERVEIGLGILPIYSRSPALIAQTAAGLDNVSGGRAILGLGASGPQVVEGWHGVPFDRPVRRVREVAEVCRAVWRRELLAHEGIYELPLPTAHARPLRLAAHPVRDRVPIYMAALGPRNVEMAAEVADGWLPFMFVPELAGGVWDLPLSAGRRRRHSSLGPLEVVAGGPLAIGEDVGPLVDLARPVVALYIGGMGARGANFYNDLACSYGYGAQARRIQDLYLAGHTHEAAAAVPRRLLEQTSLIGPPAHVRERIAAYREAGTTVLDVVPVGNDPARDVRLVKEWLS